MGFSDMDNLSCIERGYGHSDTLICHECIGNRSLKSFIKKNGSIGICHYCGSRRKVITLEELMPAIMSGVHFLYSHAVDELPCDEGSYIGITYTTEQIICEELYDEIDAQYDTVLSDIVDLMYDETWCNANPFAEHEEETAYYDWQAFCKMVKEKMRFVFYRANPDASFGENPATILDTIADYVERVKLVRRIDKNTKMFRCRTRADEKWFAKRSDFAPPHPRKRFRAV